MSDSVSSQLLPILSCPRDNTPLRLEEKALRCQVNHRYPSVDGIPVFLLEEMPPNHSSCEDSLTMRETVPDVRYNGRTINGVDAYVQEWIAATNGNLYKPLVNKLNRYPIPGIGLPDGEGQSFLDLGCNWGRWCISAARRGYRVIGLDPSLEAIRAARRVATQLYVPAEYIVGDARHLPFTNGTFQRVFSYSVLQHFDKSDVRLVLNEVNRVLENGGISHIQMANATGLLNLLRQVTRGFRIKQQFDVRYWTLRELLKVFNQFIGPSTVIADGYFTLNPQEADMDLLPLSSRCILRVSTALTAVSRRVSPLRFLADSLSIISLKTENLP